jgi:hypothetical protein
LIEAILALARAAAIESRQPEPATLGDALAPPLSNSLRAHAETLRDFHARPDAYPREAIDAVAALMAH